MFPTVIFERFYILRQHRRAKTAHQEPKKRLYLEFTQKARFTGKFPAGLDLNNQIRCLLRHLPRKKLNIGTIKNKPEHVA